MSIVERAMQKAQQKAQAQSASEPLTAAHPPIAETVDPASAPSAPELARRVDDRADADRKGADRPPAVDYASLTARDLKALVHIDVDQLRLEGRLPPQELARQIDEEMRRIKWPLLAAIAGRGGVVRARNNVIQITSALPSEGKTFTSLNLAMSIARDREMRVILVDGDVARPGLTPTLGLKSHPGLNDVLEDQALDVSEVTYQTSVPGLFFVPAGKWHDQSPEFFAGSRMQQVLEALAKRAGQGVVIFDSPPLLATNEAQVASRFAGQVLLVVRAENTEQRAVLDALALLEKGTPVSAVLNRVEASALSKYYGQYYYGYGYGRNGSDENKRGAP